MSETTVEVVEELRKLKDAINTEATGLVDYLNDVSNALVVVINALSTLRRKVSELDISEVGKEQLLKSLDNWEKQWVREFAGYVKDAVVRKVNVSLSKIMKG